MAEVEKLKLEGPTTEDLNKVKESKLQSYREASKTNRFWLSNLTTSMQEDSDAEKVLKTEEAINALTKEAIQKVANEFLDGNYFLGILMPEED